MIAPIKWIDRKFDFNLPVNAYPAIIERFRGTPARLDYLIQIIPFEVLTKKEDEKWSIQEHVGHLYELEFLNEIRYKEFLAGKERLSPADMSNRETEIKNYNNFSMGEILERFRMKRTSIVENLENLSETEIIQISVHPRLNQGLRLIDWLYFMSEHDDHHLAAMSYLSKRNSLQTV